MSTHIESILLHLKNFRSITQAVAYSKYGCTRLASVINRLRRRGYKIKTELAKSSKKNPITGFGQYAIYTLEEDN